MFAWSRICITFPNMPIVFHLNIISSVWHFTRFTWWLFEKISSLLWTRNAETKAIKENPSNPRIELHEVALFLSSRSIHLCLLIIYTDDLLNGKWMTPCIVYPYAYYMFVGRKQHAYLSSTESTTIAARRKGHATEILISLQDACLVARRL